MSISSKTDSLRGVRPCIVALRVDADDGNTFWEDYLNAKSPQQLLCFSVFQVDAKDAITISHGLAFLHSGFTSNHNGSVSRHEFDAPKEITFVINFTNSEAMQELAVSLPCPRSGSLRQNQLISDRSIQRMILSSDVLLRLLVSKETQSTSSFKYEMLTMLNVVNDVDKIDVIDFKTIASYLQKFVADYFDLHPMADKIVIRTTSWKMSSSTECLILDRCDVPELPKKFGQLNISPSDDVLVEHFINDRPDAERIRIYSTRNGKSVSKMDSTNKLDTAIPTTLSSFLTFSNTPYSVDDTSTLHIDTVTSDLLHRQIHAITQRYWDTVLPYLMKADEGAEPMVFGFDFVLSPEGPVCTEVNSLESLSLNSVGDKCTYEPLPGMFNHILTRSYEHMLHDRTIVLVGVGYYAKLHFFKYIASIGAHIVLLDDKPPPPWANGYVEHYIQASLYDPARYEESAKRAAEKLKELDMKLFSVITLYEDNVPFRAILIDVLQQEGILKSSKHAISVENALRNKDKICVYNTIRRGELSYFDPSQYSIAANVVTLTDTNVSNTEIEFPHILKLSTGSCAYGCMRIKTTEDIVPAYQAAKKLIADTPANFGVGMCFGAQIFMSELYEGSEHDLDIIMCNGEPVLHMFSDNLPVAAGGGTDGNQFVEKGCVMPSTIVKGLEAKQILSDIARALNNLDLSHGVFNVEFILTAGGIRIIDVNPRPGGYYNNEWVNTITGVCTFMAEVILHSELEYFVQPLANNRSITGYNVFSKKQLTGEIARYLDIPKDVRIFRLQDPDGECITTELYATVYEVSD